MKTEDLKAQGLTEEQIKFVMAENGKDIGVEKDKVATKEGELNTANQTIKTLQETVKKFDGVDIEKLKGDLANLQNKYDADTAALRMDAALDSALTAAKVKSPKLLKNSLDREKLKLDGEKLLGLDDQLEAFKKSDPYLFDDATSPAKSSAKVDSGRSHNTPPPAPGKTGTLLGALQEKFNNEGE